MDAQQTILIVGATGNIGGGAAMALAKRGARVVLLGRNPEKLNARSESIQAALHAGQKEKTDLATLVLDISDMASVRDAAAEAMQRFPKIDGLVLSTVAWIENGPTLLPSGHEVMFATNVMGPFLFTQLLLERIQASNGLVMHVIAPFFNKFDWDDLESTRNHKTGVAYNRTKTYNRMIAGEMARRYAGKVTTVAYDPAFIIDKSDPALKEKWPSGFVGVFWSLMTVLLAKPPEVAGEPLADLVFTHPDRAALNGALYKLGKRIEKPDRAMQDVASGQRLWAKLVQMTDAPSEKSSSKEVV